MFILGVGFGWWLSKNPVGNISSLISPAGQGEAPKLFVRYSFEYLKQHPFSPRRIELVQKIKEQDGYSSWLFRFETENGLVSGQMNVPEGVARVGTPPSDRIESSSEDVGRGATKRQDPVKQYPVIIMLRGYVEKEEYQTGVGTKNAAAVFAKNGYLTVAPDFLGYGSSDPGPADDIESRLVRPATVLQLLSSLQNFPQADVARLFLWAHSNGGQIALSVLEISGKEIPTTLWAPVSKPFPYSILYYTDDSPDHGKYLRKITADFDKLYDAEQFSITNYFDWVEAPLQIHQGTADDSVPKKWSDDLVKTLKDQKKDVTYFVYLGADHNLKPSWDTVVARDLGFFKFHLK